MTTEKTDATSRSIVLCFGERGSGLLYGYATQDPVPGEPVTLTKARMILYYPSEGTLGLGAYGPPKGSRVTGMVEEATETVWQEWFAVSSKAAKVFDEWES